MTKKKTPRFEMKYPIKPIITAAVTLPAELNVWVRPWRRLKRLGPTIPTEMAGMAGMKMLDIARIRVCAVTTGQNDGKNAISQAPIAKAITPDAISDRLALSRSTKPLAGVCDTMLAIPPIVSAMPTRSRSSCSLARYTARNGPTPVCRSASKKLSQSSSRKLPVEASLPAFKSELAGVCSSFASHADA